MLKTLNNKKLICFTSQWFYDWNIADVTDIFPIVFWNGMNIYYLSHTSPQYIPLDKNN